MAQKDNLQKYDCDRSGFTYKKSQLRRQRGMLLSPDEFDDLSVIKTPNPPWGSPRGNSTTTTAVSSPTVFEITSAGVTSVSQSRDYSQEGSRSVYFMHVQGDASPTTVTADPQVAVMPASTRLTLYGRSNVNYIIFQDGNGLSLRGTMDLKLGDSLSLIYTSGTWVETSRTKGDGLFDAA